MSYGQFRRHKCGYTESGQVRFWTSFTTICPKCGERMKSEDCDEFVGYEKYMGKWYNPLTWLNWDVVPKEETDA